MKKNLSLFVLLLCLASTAFAQFKFLPDNQSQKATGIDIQSPLHWPYLLSPVRVADWTEMNTAPWTHKYEFKSVQDLVKISVNHDIANIVGKYSYKVALAITTHSPSAGGTSTSSVFTTTLNLRYDPAALGKYNDLSVYKFSNAYSFRVSITGVYEELTDPITGAYTGVFASSSIPRVAIASNFVIEAVIQTQRYDKTPMYINTFSDKSIDGRKLDVQGTLGTTATILSTKPLSSESYKPLAYELEWTYIDDYQYNVGTGVKSYAFSSASNINYDFRKNSTRVQLDQPNFTIPLIYEHGAVIFRMRMLRPKFSDYQTIEYGDWTLPDFGSVSTATSGSNPFNKYGCLIEAPHTNDNLNWQYNINFAEQGKYKHVINYFDGSLKDRQTQTKINSDAANIVAVDKVYDYEGRPSLVSLPTPVPQDQLYFRSDILTNSTTNKAYKAEDFDGLGCSRPGAIDPLHSDAQANIYYSPLNPDKEGMQQFVPDAQGYPMVHTIYSPDNTNKVEWQGGAGQEQQLVKGHGTQYEYVRARQPELDKYLGTEVGYDRYYPKQIVTDPNGQSSYSILNPQGKVVISALQGNAPSADTKPIDELDNFVAGSELCSDLLKSEEQQKSKNGLNSFTTIYNDAPGKNTLKYKVTTFPYFTGCSNQFLWTTGYYDINVSDDCGKKYDLLSTSGTVFNPTIYGAFGASIGAGAGKSEFETSPILSDLSVPKGKILVDKKLYFSEYDIRNQVRGFVKHNEPICFSPEEFFIRQAVLNTEFPCKKKYDNPEDDDNPCDQLREQMKKDLYPTAKYGTYLADEDGTSFKDEKPNSIFSIIGTDIVTPPGALLAYVKGYNEQCNVKGCGTTGACSEGTDRCGCADGAHTYPDKCCNACLMSFCKCIKFPTAYKLTPVFTTKTISKSCREDKRPYTVTVESGWRSSYIKTPFGTIKINIVEEYWLKGTKTCCDGKLHVFEGPKKTRIAGFDVTQLTIAYEAAFGSVSDLFNSRGDYDVHYCSENITELDRWDITFIDNVDGKPFAVDPKYRYQSDCGITLPSSVTHKGKIYKDLASLDPQTFINIFNDKIADALLPLHPEYCRLLNCELTTGTFERKFEEIESFQEAEAAGMFSLDDIINKDPLPGALGGTSSSLVAAFKNALKIPFSFSRASAGVATIPSGVNTFDKDAITYVYCGAGNYEERVLCAASKYASEISSMSFSSNELKQRYFETLKAMYLGNRNLLKQYKLDQMNAKANCAPCDKHRMKQQGTSVFKPLIDVGVKPIGSDEIAYLDELPDWKKSMYLGAMNGTLTSHPYDINDQYASEKDNMATDEVDAIMDALKDCGIDYGSKAVMRLELKNKIIAGEKLTPTVVKNALQTALGGASFHDLCHPFLVSYGLFPDEKQAKINSSNFACGNPNLLTGLRDFLNRAQVKAAIETAATSGYTRSSNFVLSPSTNAFEAAINTAVGPHAVFYVEARLLPVDPTCTSSCINYVQLTMRGNSSLYINIQSQNSGPSNDIKSYANYITGLSLPWGFQNPKCINEETTANTFGLITQKTASIQAAATTFVAPGTLSYYEPKYFVWSSFADLMNPAPNAASMTDAITCIDIKKAIETFSGADKTTYAYSDKANHPYFEKIITNYLNYTFNKKHNYQQYRDLMDGCAIGDKTELKRETAHFRIEFSSESAANTFKEQIKTIGLYQPLLFHYKSASTHTIFIDISPVNSIDVPKYISYMQGTGGTLLPSFSGDLSRTAHYRADDHLLFTPTDCPFSGSALPTSPATSYSSTNVQVWENGAFHDYKMHSFKLITPNAKDNADLQDFVNNYLHGSTAHSDCKVGYVFWNTELLRSKDHSNPLRQAYLSYVYGLSSTITSSRSSLLAALDPSALPANLGSPYTTLSSSYNDPYCSGNRMHLYAYNPNPTVFSSADGFPILKNIILATAVNYGASAESPFPNADITPKSAFDITTGTRTSVHSSTYHIIRKANGDYWYRFFNGADKMHNAFIIPPSKKLARAFSDYRFDLSTLKLGQQPRTFTITATVPFAIPALSITCQGYTDFDLYPSHIATNLILDQKNLVPYDSLDCESDLMSEAIRNGKAAYYQYFENNVAIISADYMKHLVNTTKEEMTFCGRQQQYQQTLYYYDRVGNLTRTVPPAGIVPLPALGYSSSGFTYYGINNAEKYRDNPAQYHTDHMGASMSAYKPHLTDHKKTSYYQYNSLNQLVYQKTPDGGITYFFYDAAGRQIFSQNSKQRKDGLYTYSLYDEQGRPAESGQVELGCKYPATVDFDLSPCTTYYTRTTSAPGTSIATTGAHPDYVQYAFDESSYPYDELKHIIRSKRRNEIVITTYDNMTQDLGIVAGEKLSTQENLRSRVAAIKYYNGLAPSWVYTSTVTPTPFPDATFATYYSYDLSGNVQTITYDYPQLLGYEQRYKRIDYDYDLVSGKVNMISYNRGHPDQFYQQYDYDADNRITKVNTSNDGLIWNEDAKYEYYKHGPLARLMLGNQKIQSLEYAYTIQGWLKAINGDVLNPNKEMGQNGLSADMTYPRDVVAHALRYFDGDYKSIGGTNVINLEPLTNKNLYNGNISEQTTGIAGLGTLMRTYQYDQLQRLKLGTNATVDDLALTATPSDIFKSSYQYDMDGNITQLQRWDGTTPKAVLIDNFTYNYQVMPSGIAADNNKLLQVDDRAAATTFPPLPALPLGGEDLQPGQPTDNYSYDKTGNLIRDKQAAEHILWDRFGKVISIRDTVTHRYIVFGYDGKGNRIWKEVVNPIAGANDDHQGEYYVRDASGNILSVLRTRSKFNRPITLGTLTATSTTGGGTVLLDALSALADRSYPTALMSVMHSSHSGFVDAYTDKPVSFYLRADPALQSTLIFTGEAWIDALRDASPAPIKEAFLKSGLEVQPLFYSALDHPTEAVKLLEHYSREMPRPACQEAWGAAHTQFVPGSHNLNALNLYNALLFHPQDKPRVVDQLVKAIMTNYSESLPNAEAYYTAVIADNGLWQSTALRAQNGPWTIGIRNIINNNIKPIQFENFFDTWAGAATALAACTDAKYKLSTIYQQEPATALRDMSAEASSAEIVDILAAMGDLTLAEFGSKLVDAGASSPAVNATLRMGTSGDTISLAEHHIYGSSRLGVQRYDSLGIANILHIPTLADERRTLLSRVPWYSYPFADIIKGDDRSPYAAGLSGNAYLGNWNTSRTLGRRYYEMTDHLGNVLATVLDRKTGAGTLSGSSGTLYDHWSADLASTADYYPGGMMMPGRNTEYSWSRFGAQKSSKDDEVYGKGNFVDLGAREFDTRILRVPTIDPLFKETPYESPYGYAGNSFIRNIDRDGMTKTVFHVIINEQTGNVQIKKETSGGLKAEKRTDYYSGLSHYDWYDYSQTKVTYTDKSGRTTEATSPATRDNDNPRAQTMLPIETYAQLKAGDGVFEATKENRMFDGYILSGEGADASGNGYSPNAGPGSQMVDAGAVLRMMSGFGNISNTVARKGPERATEMAKYIMTAIGLENGLVQHVEAKINNAQDKNKSDQFDRSGRDTFCNGCGNNIGSGSHGFPKSVINEKGDTVEKIKK